MLSRTYPFLTVWGGVHFPISVTWSPSSYALSLISSNTISLASLFSFKPPFVKWPLLLFLTKVLNLSSFLFAMLLQIWKDSLAVFEAKTTGISLKFCSVFCLIMDIDLSTTRDFVIWASPYLKVVLDLWFAVAILTVMPFFVLKITGDFPPSSLVT